jgi:hypothetical protein
LCLIVIVIILDYELYSHDCDNDCDDDYNDCEL